MRLNSINSGPNLPSLLFSYILDIFFAPTCFLCGERIASGKIPFCQGCWAEAKPVQNPLCRKCGLPLFLKDNSRYEASYFCSDCRQQKWVFDRARSGYIFDGPVREAIHKLKYEGHFSIAEWLGKKMVESIAYTTLHASFMSNEITKKDDNPRGFLNESQAILIPVPLSPKRLRYREFNQSFMLARAVGRILNLPVASSVLERLDGALPQVGLTTKERWLNVKGSFTVQKPHYVVNKKILLIDDVITTGATVNECARVLKKAGAAEIEIWTLARTAQFASVPT